MDSVVRGSIQSEQSDAGAGTAGRAPDPKYTGAGPAKVDAAEEMPTLASILQPLAPGTGPKPETKNKKLHFCKICSFETKGLSQLKRHYKAHRSKAPAKRSSLGQAGPVSRPGKKKSNSNKPAVPDGAGAPEPLQNGGTLPQPQERKTTFHVQVHKPQNQSINMGMPLGLGLGGPRPRMPVQLNPWSAWPQVPTVPLSQAIEEVGLSGIVFLPKHVQRPKTKLVKGPDGNVALLLETKAKPDESVESRSELEQQQPQRGDKVELPSASSSGAAMDVEPPLTGHMNPLPTPSSGDWNVGRQFQGGLVGGADCGSPGLQLQTCMEPNCTLHNCIPSFHGPNQNRYNGAGARGFINVPGMYGYGHGSGPTHYKHDW